MSALDRLLDLPIRHGRWCPVRHGDADTCDCHGEVVESIARAGFDRMAEACRDQERWDDLTDTVTRDYHLTLVRYHLDALAATTWEEA